MHEPAVAETHLMLGGMHIDIDQRRLQFQIQHEGRVATMKEYVLVRLLDGVTHQLVADDAAVDVEVLQIRLTARESRQTHPTPQPQPRGLNIDLNRILDKRGTTHQRHATLLLLRAERRMQMLNHPLIVPQAEGDIEAAEGEPLHHFFETIEFGFLGAQKLLARRRVEEKIPHLYRGALWMRGRRDRGAHLLSLCLHTPGSVIGGHPCSRGQLQSRDRTDTRERFAAKSQTGNVFEIIEIGDLAGGVAAEGQPEIVLDDASTIVTNTDELAATLFDVDLDTVGTGIETIFQQFLDHGGGSFNDLAGGNLVRQALAEKGNAGHSAEVSGGRYFQDLTDVDDIIAQIVGVAQAGQTDAITRRDARERFTWHGLVLHRQGLLHGA